MEALTHGKETDQKLKVLLQLFCFLLVIRQKITSTNTLSEALP